MRTSRPARAEADATPAVPLSGVWFLGAFFSGEAHPPLFLPGQNLFGALLRKVCGWFCALAAFRGWGQEGILTTAGSRLCGLSTAAAALDGSAKFSLWPRSAARKPSRCWLTERRLSRESLQGLDVEKSHFYPLSVTLLERFPSWKADLWVPLNNLISRLFVRGAARGWDRAEGILGAELLQIPFWQETSFSQMPSRSSDAL